VAVAIDPGLAKTLSDARLQLHHAAQLVTATGISYLPAQPDLSLSVVGGDAQIVASTLLNGLTIDDAADWLRVRISERGADGDRLTLKRHYEIPSHALDDGGTFDTKNAAAFAQLDAWYFAANRALEYVRSSTSGAGEIRCWPHHFDIATLIDLGRGRTIGVGMEPGDTYYDEPYFYVNAYPSPKAESAKAPLDGGGTWHTREWVGAVLPGSRLGDESAAADQVRAFLDSAIVACRELLA